MMLKRRTLANNEGLEGAQALVENLANHEGLEGAQAPVENCRGAVADGISETVVGWADADDVQTETVREHDKDSLEHSGDGRRGLMARLRAEHQAEDILGKFLINQCNNAGVSRETKEKR